MKSIVRYAWIWPVIVIFAGCTTARLRMSNLQQPVTLGKVVGIPKVDLPPDAKKINNVEGMVMVANGGSGNGSSYSQEINSAELPLLNFLKTNPERCIVNTKIKVKAWGTLGGAMEEISFTGECYDMGK